MKLAQTLAGDWIITVPNPEEEFCSTELAFFQTTATAEDSPARRALEVAVAQAAAALLAGLDDVDLSVESHDSAVAKRMHAKVVAAGGDAGRMSHSQPPRW